MEDGITSEDLKGVVSEKGQMEKEKHLRQIRRSRMGGAGNVQNRLQEIFGRAMSS